MLTSAFSISSSEAILPENLPEQSQASNHVRVIEGENITAYARALYTSPDNPNNHEVSTSDPHDGVAKLILTRTDGTFGCTGTLASDNIHVFTAAHCVADDFGNYILDSGSATFEGNSQSISIPIDPSNSVKHPAYDGDFIKGNDIAILKLVSSPAGVPGTVHATSGNAVGSVVNKTGYGLSGFFSSGTDSSTYPFGTQRDGQNRYDAFGDTMYSALGLTAGADYVPGAVYQFDSDDGTSKHDAFDFFFGISNTGLGNGEVMSASGDSGGPTFENGELVGITSYGITLQYNNRQTSDCTKQFGQPSLDSSCGEFAGDTRVASYSTWIDTIISTQPNDPPTADANGPYIENEDSSILFDGTGSSDPDGDTLIYSWDFGDGSTGSGATPTHVYSWGDTFDVTLTVSDGKGGSDIALSTATVAEVNDAPTADANGPYTGTVNEAISFDGTGSTDYDNQDGTLSNDQTLEYVWEFGSGTIVLGISPSHTFTSTGTFPVKLTVLDGETSHTSVTSVTVNDVSAEVSINDPITNNSVAKGQSVSVTISGSGFVTGASVTLSNGSGPTPTVSNVVVNEETQTITATITAKSGGPPRDSVWDVTVTNNDLSSDTLVGGFTVTPN